MQINKEKFKDVKELDEHTAVGYLRVSMAVISKNNVRTQDKRQDAFTDVTLGTSIKDFGLANLPLCTPEGEILCGSRRLRAFKDEEWIPVIIRDNLDDSQQLEISLHENWSRCGLSIEDEIASLQKYIKANPSLTMPEIAKKLHVPLTWVTDKLQIDKNLIPLLKGRKILKTEGMTKERERKTLSVSKASTLARDWIPDTVKEKFLEKIETEGVDRFQLQREVGKGKIVLSIIDEEEDPDIKKKLEEKYGGEKAWTVEPKTVTNEKFRLHGQVGFWRLEDVEYNIEDFETDELPNNKVDVKIPDDLKHRIDTFFLRKHGEAPKFQLVIRGKLPPETIEELKQKMKPFSKEILLG